MKKLKCVTFYTDDGTNYVMRNLSGRNKRETLQAAIDALPQDVDFLLKEDLQSIFDRSLTSEEYKTDMRASGLWFDIKDEPEN